MPEPAPAAPPPFPTRAGEGQGGGGDAKHDREPVTLPALFSTFLLVSLCGFGGPFVWLRRFLIERRGWLDEAEFADILSFCQFMPGPNVVGITICVGARFRGAAGALVALAGFIVIPWGLGFALGALWLEYAHVAVLQHALHGISAAASGLIVATGLRLLSPQRRRPAALLFAALAFIALLGLRLPLLVVVLLLLPLSILAARPEPVAAA